MLLRKVLSRKWWLTTLLVFAGTLVLIRLGIWQLDRLEGKRALIAHVQEVQSMPVLDLNADVPDSISDMEYRAVKIIGIYDFENQIAVRNQYFRDQYGYHLLTPLHTSGTAVLVDRGWVPAEGNAAPEDWRKYDEPGEVSVEGWIMLGQGKPALGGVADALPGDGSPLEFWNNADVANIAAQLPYPILPIYIQPVVDENDLKPPIPIQSELDLTEGSHFGYALQWFTFAAILFVGYPFFLRKQESKTK